MCDPAADGIGQVLEAATRLGAETGAPGRHPADQLVRLRHVIDLLELAFAERAAAFAATDAYDEAGYVSPVAWLRHECQTNGTVAATAIGVGEEIDRLPATKQALEEGRIGFGHLALLARTARAVRESGGAVDEVELLGKALKHSVSRFRHDCEHARHAADPRGYLSDQVEQVEARFLEFAPAQNGALWLRGFLDSVGGAALRTALEPLATPAGADDGRSRNKRLADALVEFAVHGLDAGVAESPSSRRPHLQVTASIETIAGLEGAAAGELEFAGPVPAETVRRLACDSSVARVVLDEASAVVNVGRARRLPSGATRRALFARDKGCVWPGCDRPASWTAAHHLQHWADGGTTDLANLALICHRHHWKVHEGGWRLVRSEDNSYLALPPWQGRIPNARPPGEPAAA